VRRLFFEPGRVSLHPQTAAGGEHEENEDGGSEGESEEFHVIAPLS